MIKINLTTAKKQVDISNLGGFDLTKLKIKAVILAIAIMYVPDFVLDPMWVQERDQANQELSTKQGQASSLKRKVASAQDYDKQIRELKAQEDNLGQKLTAVKKAISEKKNPAPILLYVSKNIPQELWVKELVLENDTMSIKGEALDYTSIGNFVNNLRSSVFIKEANIISTNSTVRETDKRRIESFEVRFVIGRFEQ